MSMRDLHSNIALVQGIKAQTITTGGGAKNTGDVDLQGFNSAVIAVNFGSSGDTLAAGVKFDVKLEHADDNGAGAAGTYAAVAAKDVNFASPVVTPDASGNMILVDAPGEDNSVHKIGYVGNKRFIKCTVTPSSGNTNGTPVSVTIIKGNPAIAQ
jgi:hypothetical protein